MNPLADFHEHMRSLEPRLTDAPILVAVSGGCDSVVLLHLLRFGPGRHRLTVAHLDHAMRRGSTADADWVRGLCRGWQIPLISDRLTDVPRSEDDARTLRYAFLREAATEVGARFILTAHHADDQAETVLFRVLRGTGIPGLTGIPAVSPNGLIRPLLPYWREELERYAHRAGLRWREDATNRNLDVARNRIRHDLLPRVEQDLFPGARRNLVALAEMASENEASWSRLIERDWDLLVRSTDSGFLLARDRLRDYDPALAARVLRRVGQKLGIVLTRSGTRRALQFITDAPSGRHLQLPGGLRVLLEFGEARIERQAETPPIDEPLTIAGPSGTGIARLGGHRYAASWSTRQEPDTNALWNIELSRHASSSPLLLRARRPGDRIRTAAGTKTLKKVFLEQRTPRSARAKMPVLVDSSGAVLWAAGVASVDARGEGERLFVSISDA